jgi:putative oxidoreductase
LKIAVTAARILLGIMFLVFGLNGFLHFIPAPPMSGFPAQFFEVLFASGFYVFIFGVQTIVGILLLTNQYVSLAIALLAPVLANILVFHITMNPTGIAPGLLATFLWIVVAWPLRSRFTPLFART